eukprot:RCo047739
MAESREGVEIGLLFSPSLSPRAPESAPPQILGAIADLWACLRVLGFWIGLFSFRVFDVSRRCVVGVLGAFFRVPHCLTVCGAGTRCAECGSTFGEGTRGNGYESLYLSDV